MKHAIIYLPLTILLMACQSNEQVPDAYGNFEATEVTVSAETAGKIQFLHVTEGETLQQGQFVGLIDTTQLYLRKKQLQASLKVIRARTPGISSQVAVLREQKRIAEKELRRFQELAQEGAATQKQVDDLQAQVDVLEKQIQSTRTQEAPLLSELDMIQAQTEQIEDQIQDARIEAPISGRVLLKLAESGEIVTPGMPLFRMASLDTLTLRAYISGRQLSEIKLGQAVQVMVDKAGGEYKSLDGILSWIADQAEFTPKVIQTRDERVDLVYAIKVRVPNDGSLKIGMPGEVIFQQVPGSHSAH